jgi:hypothetical protein
MKHAAPALVCLMLTACGPAPAPPADAPAEVPATPPAPPPVRDYPLVDPIEPGKPGGLSDDRTPISEAPFTPQSAQGAANVVQTYFAHIGQKDFAQAYPLWGGDGEASGMTEAQFAANLDRYYQYSAHIGAPGEIEGAAGSLYVTVPVQIYGRLKSGEPFHQRGDVTLRRVNDVPGSTERQRLWHIAMIEVMAVP